MRGGRWSLGLVLLPGGRDWLPVALGRDPDATLAAAWRWGGERLGLACPEVRVEAVIMRWGPNGHPEDRAMNRPDTADGPPDP